MPAFTLLSRMIRSISSSVWNVSGISRKVCSPPYFVSLLCLVRMTHRYRMAARIDARHGHNADRRGLSICGKLHPLPPTPPR
jgi:hypothetical protein